MSAVPPSLWTKGYIPTVEDWQSAFSGIFTTAPRLQDWRCITDYPMPGGDAAVAFRQALSSNARIWVPPGVYTFKSRVNPNAPVIYQNSPCVLLAGLSNVHLMMHGAVFLIDPSVAGPNPYWYNCGSSHFLIQGDCKNITLQGGELVGLRYGLPSNTLNNGVAISSATQVTIRDMKFSGDYSNGSAITGTQAFETTVENCWFDNVALPADMAHVENFTFRGNRCFADQAVAGRTGFKVFWDAATVGNNVVTLPSGTSRALRGGQANNVKVTGNLFQGYPTGVFIEGVDGAEVSSNVIRDGLATDNANNYAGVVVAGSAAAQTAGKATRAVAIIGNDIAGNGNSGTGAGAGVIVAPAPSGIVGLLVKDNRIRDNTNRGVAQVNITGLVDMVVEGNDFAVQSGSPQTAPFDAGLLTGLKSALVIRNNTGYNPTEIISNRTLPGATGTGNVVYNENGFPCAVYITNTTSTVSFPRYLRAGQSSGDPLAAGGIANGQMVTYFLFPGDGIYFDSALPTSWYWFGV